VIERPNTQFRIFRSKAVGDNQAGGIGAMTLPGTRIRGVIVDNPSGSWVMLDGVGLGFQPFIAPYTLAWSVSVLPSIAELSAAYVAGPIGQPSSSAGAPMVVYVFEAQVPSSGGSAFIQPVPEVIPPVATTLLVSSTGLTTVDYEPGIPTTSRMRLLSCQVGYDYTDIGFVLDSNASVIFRERLGVAPPGVTLGQVGISPESPQQTFDFGGLTMPPGQHLYIASQSAFNVVPVIVTPIYFLV
jgi:hypothetical protein